MRSLFSDLGTASPGPSPEPDIENLGHGCIHREERKCPENAQGVVALGREVPTWVLKRKEDFAHLTGWTVLQAEFKQLDFSSNVSANPCSPCSSRASRASYLPSLCLSLLLGKVEA